MTTSIIVSLLGGLLYDVVPRGATTLQLPAMVIAETRSVGEAVALR